MITVAYFYIYYESRAPAAESLRTGLRESYSQRAEVLHDNVHAYMWVDRVRVQLLLSRLCAPTTGAAAADGTGAGAGMWEWVGGDGIFKT